MRAVIAAQTAVILMVISGLRRLQYSKRLGPRRRLLHLFQCFAEATENSAMFGYSLRDLCPSNLHGRLVKMKISSYPSSVTSYCEPCNLACSACIDPSNSISSCSACAAGFTGNPPGGVVCASCFSGCATCTSAVSYACSACKYQYFHYSPNNSCLTSCPSAYYGV